ncbi:MAG TPA: GDSL-type esterase/lipase family protein [Puia sp.]|nr:GDSL-type esterase/lipase family protein [Puia sp.]
MIATICSPHAINVQRTALIVTLLLFPFFGHPQTNLTNQRVFDTTGFVPEHYPERVATFAKEPVVKGRIIFLGNSITEIGDWKKLLNDSTVINRGIGGDITFGVLKRLDDVIVRQPSKLFLLIGINDIGKDIPDAVIADNIRKIIVRVQKGSPSTKIYIESILPVNPEMPNFPQHYDKQEHILSTNKLIERVAADSHCTYVNIHDLLADAHGRLEAKYSWEGLHLNPAAGGYERWVTYLREKGYL